MREAGELRKTAPQPYLWPVQVRKSWSPRSHAWHAQHREGLRHRPPVKTAGMAPVPAVNTSSSSATFQVEWASPPLSHGGRNRSLNNFNISKGLVDKADQTDHNIVSLPSFCSSELWVLNADTLTLPTSSHRQPEPLQCRELRKGVR